MDKKQSRWDKMFKFMGDKGFYIVLFLCVAVIGVSAWVISGSIGGGLKNEADNDALTLKVSAPPVSVPPIDESIKPPVTAAPTAAPSAPVSAPPSNEPVYEPESEPAESVMAESSIPTSFVWPAAGTIETPHSVEALVYSRTMADWRTHSGIDIAANMGAKVMAAADGSVERIYTDAMYGTTVVIQHGGGLKSVYSNLAETPTVKEGDSVKMADTIGSVGETALAEIGDVTHLHFEMTLDGERVDPQSYLPAR